jgi:hypothetical protein
MLARPRRQATEWKLFHREDMLSEREVMATQRQRGVPIHRMGHCHRCPQFTTRRKGDFVKALGPRNVKDSDSLTANPRAQFTQVAVEILIM